MPARRPALGSIREDELTQARDRQRQLERRAGQLSADSAQRAAARLLARLTGDMIQELAGDAGEPEPIPLEPSGAAGIPAS